MTGGGLTLSRITVALLFLAIAYLAGRNINFKAILLGEKQKNERLQKENSFLKDVIAKFKKGEYTKEEFFNRIASFL